MSLLQIDNIKKPFNYEEANNKDLIKPLFSLFQKGLLMIRNDGKFDMRTGIAVNTPWVFAGDRIGDDANCILFHSVILKYFNFIPERCQGCWKVVARPRSVAELFAVSDFQQTSSRPSKAGIEVREWTSALYGAYWYNTSIEKGIECKKYVKSHFPDMHVILKRGCTEFERKFGDSTKWVVTDEARELETLLREKVIIPDYADAIQPEELVNHVKCRWIEFAYEHGDKTYLQFTDGKPLFPNLVEYYDEEEYRALQAG